MMPPSVGDLLFPGMSEEELSDMLIEAMAEAGIRESLIWIFIETGMTPTEENWRLMDRQQRREITRAERKWNRGNIDIKPLIEAARARNKERARATHQSDPRKHQG